MFRFMIGAQHQPAVARMELEPSFPMPIDLIGEDEHLVFATARTRDSACMPIDQVGHLPTPSMNRATKSRPASSGHSFAGSKVQAGMDEIKRARAGRCAR